MKISLAWVGEFVDLGGEDPGRIAELLSLHTAEVDGLERFGAEVADVRVGQVAECGAHPNAEKLSLCRVDFGAGETVQVVCGASNVRKDQKIAFAPAGSTLPGGVKLKKARLRGQESCGMILSERELAFSDEHEGILVLPEDAPVGTPLADYLGLEDSVLELDNKSLTHRPDLWGHYGFARELAAILGRELKPLPVLEAWPEEAGRVPIRLEDPESCPLYLGLEVDLGRPPGVAPMAIRRRLLAVGQRPISDVVDLTNFVLQETGQPTHAFDLARLEGPEIRVRRARDGEGLTTLDGVERRLAGGDLVIADARQAVALAGVMGGGESEVGAETTRILLESAWFAPARIRRTSQRLALRTEASARFEKCLDPALAEEGLRRFAFLLGEQLPGARVVAAPGRAGEARAPEVVLTLDPRRCATLLSLPLERDEVEGSLRALGFGVEDAGEEIRVRVPSWRSGKDVTLPIDLVEEVGRLHGYHQVAPLPLEAPLVPPWTSPVRLLARRLSDRISLAHGGYETQAYTFLDSRWPARLGQPREAFVSIANPVQADCDLMRRDPVPSLLEQAAANVVEYEDGLLYEIAKGYEPREGELPRERVWIGAVLWRRKEAAADGPGSVFGAARSLVEDLLRATVLEGASENGVERAAAPWCHPARGLTWSVGGERAGFSGVVDPRLAEGLDLHRARTAAVLLDLEVLARAAEGHSARFAPPGRFPAVKVDVALALPEAVPFAEVESALRRAGGRTLESLELFDLFRGGAVGNGMRSLAFHARLRAGDRTLDDKDERKFLDRVARVAEELGGRLRS